ncbi:hypothetical protein GCM10023156_41020 [Novipirellula rosea]|uniref:Uncharacterized protein n=1 Tax=Novipirellula rosea TaxID=1031540 RepID=A0ABP8N5K3_9BACT
MANREHKAYPNIRETPFYSPCGSVVIFHKWMLMPRSPLIRVVRRLDRFA